MDIQQSPEQASKGRRERKRHEAAERRRQALELRKAGATYDAIAQQLGYKSRDGAWRAIRSALKDVCREPAEDVRDLEINRLDAMLLAIWQQVRNGNHGAIDRALRIMERRAKLIGLDMPMKFAPTDPTGQNEYSGKSDSEVVEDLQRILDAARARAGREAGA